MLETAGRTLYLVIPLISSAIIHGLAIKYRWFPWLLRPVDGGRTWRGRRLFGDNKTFRGFVVCAAGAVPVTALQGYLLHGYPTVAAWEYFDQGAHNPVLYGLLLGGVMMLGELPNSFLKRQLGISPGAQGAGWTGILFHAGDQVDLLAGAWLVWFCYVGWQPAPFFMSFAIVYLAHQLVTLVGYGLGMRRTWR